MLPNAKSVDFVLRWSCAMSLVLAIIVINMTDCAKSEKIEDHEGSKFYLRTTIAWPLCCSGSTPSYSVLQKLDLTGLSYLEFKFAGPQ